MSTMKGLVVTGFGLPSKVIELSTNLPVPKITKPNEILVQVYYGTIHMGDWKTSNGDLGFLAGMMGFKPPFCPGQDYAGKVIEIGKNVTGFKIGDNVFGQVRLGNGTAKQYIIVTEDEKEIFQIPNNLSLLHASSVPCSLETAYQGLVDYGDLQNNETILILGGTTVIGMYAIQIAKNVFNCQNITCTSSKEDLCKSLGADRVINYKKEKWEVVLKDSKYDMVFDVMGGSISWNNACSYNVLKNKGKYVTVAGDFGSDVQITCCIMCGVMCSVLSRMCCACCCGKQKYIMVNQSRSKSMDEIIKLLNDDKVKPAIDPDSPYQLDNYLALYEKSMGRAAHGKLLLTLCDDIDNSNDNNDDNTNNTQNDDDQKEEEEENNDINDNENNDDS